MKTTLFCLVIAVLMRGTFDIITAQTAVAGASHQQSFAFFRPWDGTNWMTLRCQGDEKWHPSFTDIVVEYKPIVRRLGKDRYEITFTSEIAEKIP